MYTVFNKVLLDSRQLTFAQLFKVLDDWDIQTIIVNLKVGEKTELEYHIITRTA